MPPIYSQQGKLLDHQRLSQDKAKKMMITYLGTDLTDSQNEVVDTKGTHTRFKFL